MRKKMLQIIVAVLSFLALANVASASSVMHYQPELPEALKGRKGI